MEDVELEWGCRCKVSQSWGWLLITITDWEVGDGGSSTYRF